MLRTKHILLMVFALMAMMIFTSEVKAVPVAIGDKIIFSDGPGNTGGGEFYINVLGQGSDIDFVTFCLERNEYISYGSTYTIDNISNGAENGGSGGSVGGSDPLDPRTAYLYTQFVTGALVGYDYFGTTRANSADALQNAIWFIEQEITVLPTGLATTFHTAALTAGWTDIGSVRVLNLVDQGNNKVQDQLVMVPEPTTLILLGAGLLGLGAIRRRMRK